MKYKQNPGNETFETHLDSLWPPISAALSFRLSIPHSTLASSVFVSYLNLYSSFLESGFFETFEAMGEVIDLSGDGGVLKEIVRRAKPDAISPSDDLPLVDVHYEGILAEDEKVFDTTREDNLVFSFELGTGSVIRSWDIAVKTMKVGEVAKITCKPEYAYGRAGSPPDIPPDATLIFEVELVACRPRKGASVGSVSEERARLEDLKKQREIAAAAKEDDKKKREEAKAAAAARIQAKLDSKKGQGKGKGKGKSK